MSSISPEIYFPVEPVMKINKTGPDQKCKHPPPSESNGRTLSFLKKQTVKTPLKMVECWQWMHFVNVEVENIRLPSILQPLPSKQDLLEEI